VNIIQEQAAQCSLCAEPFKKTATSHLPRPIIWFQPGVKIIIASQAPGARAHKSGVPFDDPSGKRLRKWMGLRPDAFYQRKDIAILPMAFCFPGYNAAGSDLPPPKICAETWRQKALTAIGAVPLTLLVGAHAQKWHLEGKSTLSARVMAWRDYAPKVFPLPHPSWRNTHWLKKNPWFEEELLPVLRKRVAAVLSRA